MVRITRAAWNRAVATVPGWPRQRLAPAPLKRPPYWLREDQLPASLREQIAAYLQPPGPARPVPGAEPQGPGAGHRRPAPDRCHHPGLGPGGLRRRRSRELTSLAGLVPPDQLERALRFLYARAGDRVTPQIALLPYRVCRMGRHLRPARPGPCPARPDAGRGPADDPAATGLAAKNRRLLEHVDDPGFVDRLVTLPRRLVAAARKMTAGRLAAACARDAVAVELLLTCSMRVGNLVDLRLGETIRRFGEGATTRWAIEIPGEKVKNRQPLRFILPAESVQLLEHYLADWHGHWCGAGSPWLFPNERGGHVDRRAALGAASPGAPSTMSAPRSRATSSATSPPRSTCGRTRTGWGW